MGRRSAYRWLSGKLGVPLEKTHIASFDEPLCARVVAVCSERRNSESHPE